MMNKKIKNQKEIIKIVQELKRQNKKIVTFSGSFDILHTGHIKAIEEAKKQGDILIILLNSDKSIRGYKGPGHPINSQKDRVQLLSALEMVDYVSQFDELIPNKILSKIGPDIHCNGSDWGKDCVEKEIVEKKGGKIYVLKWNKDFSTSKLVKKILASCSKSEAKAVFLNLPKHLLDVSILKKLSKSNYKIIILNNQPGTNVKKAAQDFDLNLSKSWIVGKEKRDIMIGKMTNTRTIILGRKSAKGLLETVKIILSS